MELKKTTIDNEKKTRLAMAQGLSQYISNVSQGMSQRDAAQKVGGLGTGLFGYENENQSMSPVFDVIRKQSFSLQDFIGVPLPPSMGGDQVESLRQ